MEIFQLVYFVTGMLIGGLVAWLIAKSKFQSTGANTEELLQAKELELKLEAEKENVIRLKGDLTKLDNELRQERAEVLELNNLNTRLDADYKNIQETLKGQKEEVNQLQEKFSAEFKNLANEIFEDKSKKFTDQNKSNIGDLLKPLGERIERFERKVEQSNKDSLEQNTALKTQLDHIKELNQRITKEAGSLTKALKGDSEAQGNWGEMQLESILEKVGLEKEVHYFKEKNLKTDLGSNQRLDYIIKLPDNKYLILDSKVSLTAYSNYFDQEDDAKKERHLKLHLESMNSHIKLLGEKNYQNLHDIQQPDFVLMFVANEPALIIALKKDPNLYEKALNKNIVLVSTSTLLATLRTVSYIWKQDLQNKNAIEIARQAGALYDKFEGFTNDLIKVGNSLKQTKDSYDLAMNKLSQGSGNLVRRTENLKKLGAKASKNIDQKLLDRAEDSE